MAQPLVEKGVEVALSYPYGDLASKSVSKSCAGCANATDIYKDYGLDVTIKMGNPQVLSGT
ncbi:hypothetical protein [Nostoc sp.]|uniref:hypothetical protein n=1 Tax=Nostoc sp. TaxID=1180 RepID=UPI002FF4D6E0